MIRVIADQILREKLAHFMEAVEVCDEQGEVIGFFAPLRQQDRSLYEDAEVPVTDEEIPELLQQPLGRPLAEILADLEKQQ